MEDHTDGDGDGDGKAEPRSATAEERTTEEAAGAPAGDQDLDDLLDDPDPASA